MPEGKNGSNSCYLGECFEILIKKIQKLASFKALFTIQIQKRNALCIDRHILSKMIEYHDWKIDSIESLCLIFGDFAFWSASTVNFRRHSVKCIVAFLKILGKRVRLLHELFSSIDQVKVRKIFRIILLNRGLDGLFEFFYRCSIFVVDNVLPSEVGDNVHLTDFGFHENSVCEGVCLSSFIKVIGLLVEFEDASDQQIR